MTADTPTLRIVRRALDHPDAVRLVDEVQAEYAVLYGTPDAAPIDVSEFADGAGAFFVAHLATRSGEQVEALLGTVAWRWVPTPASLGEGRAAELKRMFVRREHRRQGHSRELLELVESSARQAGARWMVLETGERQPEAIALYESAGYVPLTGFGHYVDSGLARAFVRDLDA